MDTILSHCFTYPHTLLAVLCRAFFTCEMSHMHALRILLYLWGSIIFQICPLIWGSFTFVTSLTRYSASWAGGRAQCRTVLENVRTSRLFHGERADRVALFVNQFIMLFHSLQLISSLSDVLAKKSSTAVNSGLCIAVSGHYRSCLSIGKFALVGPWCSPLDRIFSSSSPHFLSLLRCPQLFYHWALSSHNVCHR